MMSKVNKGGRPRIYKNNAEKQAAYRLRKKLKAPATTAQRILAAKALHQPLMKGTLHATVRVKYGNLPPTGFISKLSHNEWIAKYCPRHKWKADYLTIMTDRIWNYMRQLNFLPRGHGKTWRVIALFVRWILEKRLSIMILTGGSANSKRIFRAIKALLKSPRVREDYGDVISSFNIIDKEMILAEELDLGEIDPVLRIASRGAEIVGSHPYWIHLEDIIQEPFKSHESNEALEEWFEGIVEFCATEKTKITGTGTRKDKGDFWEYLMEKLRYPAYIHKAIELVRGNYPSLNDITFNDDGSRNIILTKGEYKTLHCPSWSTTRLLCEMILKPEKFRAEMQNDPMPKGGLYFSTDDWVEHAETHIKPDTKFASFYMAVDPAFGKGQKADYTSIMVACVWKKKLYIIDGVYLRGADGFDVDQMITEMVRLANYWKVRAVLIESNNFQYLIAKMLVVRNAHLPVIEVRNVSKKIERINSLKPYFIMKSIVAIVSNIATALKNEYLSYNQEPSTASRKDDALDTLQMIIDHVAYHLGKDNRRWKYG